MVGESVRTVVDFLFLLGPSITLLILLLLFFAVIIIFPILITHIPGREHTR